MKNFLKKLFKNATNKAFTLACFEQKPLPKILKNK